MTNSIPGQDDDQKTLSFICRVLITLLMVWTSTSVVINQTDFFWVWIAESTGRLQDFARIARFEALSRLYPQDQLSVLVLGNSVAGHDIDRKLISNQLNVPLPRIELAAIPAASAIEIAMLAGEVARLKPKVVLFPLNVWTLDSHIDLEEVRAYDPDVALELFGMGHFWTQQTFHSSRLALKTNPLFQYRRVILQLLLEQDWQKNRHTVELEIEKRSFDVQSEKRNQAAFSRFRCSGPQVDALRVLNSRLKNAGSRMLLVYAPADGRWGRDPRLVTLMDECMTKMSYQEKFRYLPSDAFGQFTSADFKDQMHLKKDAASSLTFNVLPHLKRMIRQARRRVHQ